MTIDSKAVSRRGLLGGIALLGAAGCGYLIHPERRGRRGGDIDGTVLLVDILWLLPGIIPGVICLVVDFNTGCIYGREYVNADPPHEKARDLEVEIKVDGKVHAKGEVKEDGRLHILWSETPDAQALRERGRMIASTGDDTFAEARMSALI